jgi:threonine dehydrogenase-like Zn-dependent dehydrogenase
MSSALTLDFESRRLAWREVEPRGNFRVACLGVCGTDRELAAFHFGEPPPGQDHLILGHEALGQLDSGEWAVPLVRTRCSPACRMCARSRPDLCETGTFADRGIVRAHGFARPRLDLDRADSIFVPESLGERAVLVEPMSVVEKALRRALEVALSPPRTALIVGAGPIGCLTAFALLQRGLDVTVVSLEDSDSPRAKLLRSAGAEYGGTGKFDLTVEAAGVGQAAATAIHSLKLNGVALLLGARDANVEMPFRDMVLGNRTVLGSVNTDRESSEAAVANMTRLDLAWLDALIERRPFSALPRSLTEPLGSSVKLVHILNW